jgi:hypothetical protein
MFRWLFKRKKTKEQHMKENDKVDKPILVEHEEEREKRRQARMASPIENPADALPVEEEPVVVAEEPEDDMDDEVSEESPAEEEKKTKPRTQPYHITKHPDGGWQIKRGGADRALKRFDTQKEAIEYAKVIEKERGVSYIIHKADGSIRKKEY